VHIGRGIATWQCRRRTDHRRDEPAQRHGIGDADDADPGLRHVHERIATSTHCATASGVGTLATLFVLPATGRLAIASRDRAR
jgi:hypothetical protein